MTTCALCSHPLGNLRDRTPAGDMHIDCARDYRRQHPTPERESTLPKHLR